MYEYECVEDIPDFDILVWAESFQDVLRRNTHGAKPVQDGLVKPANSSKLGLNLFGNCMLMDGLSQKRHGQEHTYVERVVVPAQS